MKSLIKEHFQSLHLYDSYKFNTCQNVGHVNNATKKNVTIYLVKLRLCLSVTLTN